MSHDENQFIINGTEHESLTSFFLSFIAGQTARLGQVAPLQGVQQPGTGAAEGSLLPGPRRAGPPQATDRRRAGQCIDLLPGAE